MKLQVVEPVTITQAKEILSQAVNIYFKKDEVGNYRFERRRARPVCLMGPAGIGKTEIVHQVAQENELACLSYSITHHTRQSLIGLPRLVEGEIEGKKVSMTEYTMSEIVAQIYRCMEETGKREGILFLDEFNCSSESLRPIMLQLLQDKSFGPHAIPDGWMLVLAGNPTEYNRAAQEIDAVTVDRMRIVHICPDYAVWKKYAKERGIHPVVLSYLDNHKEHFYVYRCGKETSLVTARGWEDLALMIRYLEEDGIYPDLPLITQYLQDQEIAQSFYAYCTQYAVLISTGLAEKVLKRDPQAVLQIEKMSFERSWSLVSALLSRLHAMAEQAVELDRVADTVYQELLKLKHDYAPADKVPEEPLEEALIHLAEAVPARKTRQFFIDCALDKEIHEAGWEGVKEAFYEKVRKPRMEAFVQTEQAISNVIAICRKAFVGKPQLEFLFHTLAEDQKVLEVLSTGDEMEFRKLFTEMTAFDADGEARKLEREIQKSDNGDLRRKNIRRVKEAV